MTGFLRALTTLGVLLVLAACGGGDDAVSPTTTTPPNESTTTTEASFTGTGSEQFCAQAAQAEAELTRLAQSAPSPEASQTVFASAASALQSLAETAPEEIKGDVSVLAAAYQEVARDVQAVGANTSKMPATIARRLTQPDVRTASERLEAYQVMVCGKAPASTAPPR